VAASRFNFRDPLPPFNSLSTTYNLGGRARSLESIPRQISHNRAGGLSFAGWVPFAFAPVPSSPTAPV